MFWFLLRPSNMTYIELLSQICNTFKEIPLYILSKKSISNSESLQKHFLPVIVFDVFYYHNSNFFDQHATLHKLAKT